MNIEQPALGGVGTDSVTISLGWRWESGWWGRVAQRQSGSAEWQERTYTGRDEAELHAIISDELAAILGLV